MKILSTLGLLATLFYYTSCACIETGQLVGVIHENLAWSHLKSVDTSLAVLSYHTTFLRNYRTIHLVNESKPKDTISTNSEQKLYYLPPATYSIIIPYYMTLQHVKMHAGEVMELDFRPF